MPLDLQPSQPVAFVCAVMAGGHREVEEAITALSTRFGPVRSRGPLYPFDMSDYYEPEMGPGLVKGLTWFGGLVDPAELAERKARTMDFEREGVDRDSQDSPRRTVNIDPGLVSIDSLVLATTKPAGHRVAIAPGLYAEVTLRFERGEYRPLPWTYADYRRDDVGRFLLDLRQELKG